MSPAFQFARWDGTQNPEPFTDQDLFDALADALFAEGDVAAALRHLLDRGLGEESGDRISGMAELLERLEALRAASGDADLLARLDRLAEHLRQARDLGNLAEPLLAEVFQLLGEEAAADIERLLKVSDRLRRAGYVREGPDGLSLTAQGARRIGQRAISEIFASVAPSQTGRHDGSRELGLGGDRSDETAQYAFGDPFLLAVEPTVKNALRRHRSGRRVPIEPSDFEVFRSQKAVGCATVLLLDASRSMLLRGCHVAAKKVALALQSLIETRFPDDRLYLVAFSDVGRELAAEDLPTLDYKRAAYGTNLQHALSVASRLLARHRAMSRQIILVTDGEPTAWYDQDRLRLAYPPTFETYRATLREVSRCTRDGIRINTFMLERSRHLAEFVERLARVNRGRTFQCQPDRLGQYVLVDYVSQRRSALA